MKYTVKNLSEDRRKKGRYMMDYSKKFGDPFDVSEKAKEHVNQLCREKMIRKEEIC